MTQEEAKRSGLCKQCTSFRPTGKGRDPECVATLWESLNYRHTTMGMCALTNDEIKRRMKGVS